MKTSERRKRKKKKSRSLTTNSSVGWILWSYIPLLSARLKLLWRSIGSWIRAARKTFSTLIEISENLPEMLNRFVLQQCGWIPATKSTSSDKLSVPRGIPSSQVTCRKVNQSVLKKKKKPFTSRILVSPIINCCHAHIPPLPPFTISSQAKSSQPFQFRTTQKSDAD